MQHTAQQEGQLRTESRSLCPHAPVCPGCPLIHLSYGAQCEAKKARVVGAISPYSTLRGVRVEQTLPAQPIEGYRVRAKLIVGPGPAIGLYEKGAGHRIVDIPECRVLSPLLKRTADAMRALLRHPVPEAGAALLPYESSGEGALTALDLRLSTDSAGHQSVLLTLVLEQSRVPGPEQLAAAASAVHAAAPWVAGVAANIRAQHMPQVLGPSTRVLSGAALIRDHGGDAYQLSGYGSFVQAHPEQARTLRARLASALEGERRLLGQHVVDVYGGSGAIGLGLARAGAHVTMIESFAPAAENALAAAREQAAGQSSTFLGSFAVRIGDAGRELRRLAAEARQVDALVMNPPRRGVDSVARRTIVGLHPRVLAYVSCNPVSLARDLDHFARLGYSAASLQPVDMIPLTEQVEVLAILKPAVLPSAEILHEDDLVVIASKGPDEPMTSGQGYPASFLQRVARAWSMGRRSKAFTTPPKAITSVASGASGIVLLGHDLKSVHDAMRSRALDIELTYIAMVRGATPSRGEFMLQGANGPGRHRGRPNPRARPPKEAARIANDAVRQGTAAQPDELLDRPVQYERVERLGRHALLALRTGVVPVDALRCALARIAHPVVGDERWGHEPTNRHMAEKHGLGRLFLHCASVCVRHSHRAPVSVHSPLWPDLEAVLGSLRASGSQ